MDFSKLMQQAQQMQAGMQQKQAELETKIVEGYAGGDKVKVKANGSGDILEINIAPEIVDPSDTEFLEELVLTAVQDALKKAKEESAAEMKSVTGGLDLGNMLG